MVSEAGSKEVGAEDGWHRVGPPMARNPALSGEDQWGDTGTGPIRDDGRAPHHYYTRARKVSEAALKRTSARMGGTVWGPQWPGTRLFRVRTSGVTRGQVPSEPTSLFPQGYHPSPSYGTFSAARTYIRWQAKNENGGNNETQE